MNKATLLLGSNRSPRHTYMENALKFINTEIGEILKKTNVIETKPSGIIEQNDFLNQILEVNTELYPNELLKKIKEIEKKVGRSQNMRWGEREIDIDILFFNNIMLETDNLIIPHPQVEKRSFVKELLKSL